MRTLPYRVVDADNHYYEAPDAFTRHIDRKMQSRCMQWAEIGGKPRLLVGGSLQRFIPNPLFDPVSKPGALHAYFAGEANDGADMRELFGELEPIRPEYRDRDARLAVMDEQGVDEAVLFPTLGVGMERALARDPEASVAAFSAFNRWLDEDWGFAYRDRIFAVPYITLTDVDAAIAELEWVLDHGARMFHVRTAPVPTREGPRSPAHPSFDPFWARVQEAGIAVATHVGDAGYAALLADQWEPLQTLGAFRSVPLRLVIQGHRDIHDFCAAVICHGLFDRFPGLRLFVVEHGAAWVGPLKHELARAWAQNPRYFPEHPVEVLDRHVWVTPFWEDDIDQVVQDVATDRIVFGSDWPHAEGNAHPLDYADAVAGLDEPLQRRILRDNALALLTPGG